MKQRPCLPVEDPPFHDHFRTAVGIQVRNRRHETFDRLAAGPEVLPVAVVGMDVPVNAASDDLGA